ncbi:hypothetical protein DT076_04885 [Desertihabitans brevis]|uniref:Metallopeptidase family protein n=1 Tax=Desertihabitans brevis TaxID=2268447 RepID=A0A367Z0K9_9ACTN|nr:metallopeptidase family protein [Desertihabitans brevis]RCK70741.1 hypothetical protein DT076_04885 [Desertihabitans brevis]
MPSRRRDRHQRGIRGPMALPNRFSRQPVRLRRTLPRAEVFDRAVHEAVQRVRHSCPEAVERVEIGVEDVPLLASAWSGDQVPLAAAVEATVDVPGRVVLYRRPLELRAEDTLLLRELVHQTLVEQLAALTGLSVHQIDPDADEED